MTSQNKIDNVRLYAYPWRIRPKLGVKHEPRCKNSYAQKLYDVGYAFAGGIYSDNPEDDSFNDSPRLGSRQSIKTEAKQPQKFCNSLQEELLRHRGTQQQ